MKLLLSFLLSISGLLFSSIVISTDFPATAGIYLVNSDQIETKIGEVNFTATENNSATVMVNIDNSVFTEHFLSMRPFRCLEDEIEWFCYLQYPYEIRSAVTLDDLSDLEYQLLFILKKPSEFGIDAWNGLYYKLAPEADGSFTGRLLEGDLNSLQSPPAEKYAKPIDLGEFIPADKSKRLFPTVRIY